MNCHTSQNDGWNMKWLRLWGALVLVCVTCAIAGSQPQSSSEPSLPPAVEPRADALIREGCQTLAGATQLSLEARVLVDEVTETGQKLQFGKVMKVVLRRPDRVAADITGDRQNYRFVFDGSTILLFDPKAREYSMIRDVPHSVDGMLDFLAEKYGIATPLADLLFSKPYESFCSRVRAGVYLGEHMVDSTPCHHLAFRTDAVDWQIWLDATPGAGRLPRKLVITYKQTPTQPQFIAVLDKWDLKAAISDDAFQTTPPAGATQLELAPLAAPAAAVPPTSQPSAQ